MVPTRSPLPSKRTYFASRASFNANASAAFTVRPSNPRQPPAGIFSARYSCTVGTPSSRIFISLIPLPASCAAACTKYRPSVHRQASSMVTTAVPADPVKPVRNFLHLKNSPTYSDSWKSAVTTR